MNRDTCLGFGEVESSDLYCSLGDSPRLMPSSWLPQDCAWPYAQCTDNSTKVPSQSPGPSQIPAFHTDAWGHARQREGGERGEGEGGGEGREKRKEGENIQGSSSSHPHLNLSLRPVGFLGLVIPCSLVPGTREAWFRPVLGLASAFWGQVTLAQLPKHLVHLLSLHYDNNA